MRILLVEDDPLLTSGLLTALRHAHYGVEHVADGVSATQALQVNHFDLVILDLGLPRMDGLDVLRNVRSGGNDVPVLILSAREGTRDRITGLDLGADDYLVKPFELDELLARIRVIERRRSGVTVNQLQTGALKMDLASFAVFWHDQLIDLQRMEFMLLKHLVESPQRVFSRAQLEESIYGWGDGAESNTIDVHVHHIRKKTAPEVIRTVRGVGYRLGEVEA